MSEIRATLIGIFLVFAFILFMFAWIAYSEREREAGIVFLIFGFASLACTIVPILG